MEKVYGPTQVSNRSTPFALMLTLDRHLPRLTPIQLRHPLDLAKRHVISILQPVSGLLESGHDSVGVAVDRGNHAGQGGFAGWVDAGEGGTKVVEGGTENKSAFGRGVFEPGTHPKRPRTSALMKAIPLA
jgi:hypothetical protein